jgi:hypothetical protein
MSDPNFVYCNPASFNPTRRSFGGEVGHISILVR